MRNQLPPNHGLQEITINNPKLLFRENGVISITDIQYQSLVHGVANGQSMLVVAPTSTGKTQIGIWALLTSLERGHQTVYLVTHKALAQQKFEDFISLLIDTNVITSANSLVVATGDQVRTADRSIPPDPLNAPILVATYEKYLAMLSSSGVPGDMTNRTIICDEVQLIGDRTRGQSVEILLTLLKRATWGQMVALSAVLSEADSRELSEWLNIQLVRTTGREKHLKYECREKGSVHCFDTAISKQQTVPRSTSEALSTIEIIAELEKQPNSKPIIVFCTKKEDVYTCAEASFRQKGGVPNTDYPINISFDEETSLAPLLSQYMTKRISFHTADLTEQERRYVENALLEGKVDIVFSTSTLAAGVNFPLSTAVFHGWHRYDFQKRSMEPLDTSEFHNMAGRVGRMGTDFHGRIIFTAANEMSLRQAKKFLDPDQLTPLKTRVETSKFVQTILQIVASGFCQYEGELMDFLLSTFSGAQETRRNPTGPDLWRKAVGSAILELKKMEFME